VRSGPDGGERDLEAALVALIEVALSGLERDGSSADAGPPTQATALARALAGVVREVIRAPLREALQAGYELGLRAAREAPPAPAEPPPPATHSPAGASRLTPRSRGAAAPSPLHAATGDPTGESAGAVVVEVSPFTSFADVNRFHAAVAGAPGVTRAAIVAFRGGRLRLRVHHPDVRALATTLDGLDVGPLRVVRMAPDALELVLSPAGSPPPLE
jgi:hypothetical protein